MVKNHTHPHPNPPPPLPGGELGGDLEGWVNDAGWYQFREWLEYFGDKFGRTTVAVNPAYTSQNCSDCGQEVKKSLSTRTHVCKCGCQLDRDHNAAINILKRALSTVGHTGTFLNAYGDLASTLLGSDLDEQVESVK